MHFVIQMVLILTVVSQDGLVDGTQPYFELGCCPDDYSNMDFDFEHLPHAGMTPDYCSELCYSENPNYSAFAITSSNICKCGSTYASHNQLPSATCCALPDIYNIPAFLVYVYRRVTVSSVHRFSSGATLDESSVAGSLNVTLSDTNECVQTDLNAKEMLAINLDYNASNTKTSPTDVFVESSLTTGSCKTPELTVVLENSGQFIECRFQSETVEGATVRCIHKCEQQTVQTNYRMVLQLGSMGQSRSIQVCDIKIYQLPPSHTITGVPATTYVGEKYRLLRQSVSRAEAVQACECQGDHLATFESDFNQLEQLLDAGKFGSGLESRRAYIDLNTLDIPGTWYWQYDNVAFNQLDLLDEGENPNQERCAVFVFDDVEYLQVACTQNNWFMCELNL